MKKRIFAITLSVVCLATLFPLHINAEQKSTNKDVFQYQYDKISIYEVFPESVETEDEKESIADEFTLIMDKLKTTDNKKEWFLEYKDWCANLYDDAPEDVYDYYTPEELLLMEKCIETECYDCPFENKVNVACVIMNRIGDKGFSNDILEVIKAENQFCYGRNQITYDTILSIEFAFSIKDTTNGCIGFNSFDDPPKEWNDWELQFTDEVGHNFYAYKEE